MGELIIFDQEPEPLLTSPHVALEEEGRKLRIQQVLMLMADGLSLTRALRQLEIPKSTWYTWSRAGHLEQPTAEFMNILSMFAAQEIAGSLQEMVEVLSSIAKGETPEGTTMEVRPQHAVAAFNALVKFARGATEEAPLNDNTADIQTFLRDYTPKRIEISQSTISHQLNFIYQGPEKPVIPAFEKDEDEEENNNI